MVKRKLVERVKRRAGMTLLEVLVGVMIISIIAAPLLSLFLSSAKNNQIAQQTTDATYLAQKLIEDRIPLGYEALLASQTAGRVAENGFYYEVRCEPAGAHDDLFSNEPAYMHLVYNGTSVLAVGPDGKSSVIANAAYTLSLSPGSYSLYSGSVQVLAGVSPQRPLIVIVNGFAKDALQQFSLYVAGMPAKAVAYTGAAASEEQYSVAGLGNLAVTLSGVDDYSTSMVKTRVCIYADAVDVKPICEMEDTLTPVNPGR